MISANWMTLGFANAKRNVQAPARDPSENSAPAVRNFAEPFSCEAPSGSPGFGEVQWLPQGGTTGRWPGHPTWVCSLSLSGPTAPSLAGYGHVHTSGLPHPIPRIPSLTLPPPWQRPRFGGEAHLSPPSPLAPGVIHPSAPLLNGSIPEGRAVWVPSLTPPSPLFFASLSVLGALIRQNKGSGHPCSRNYGPW